MTPAQRLTKIVDFFYIRPVRAVIPLQTFRYAICGGVNLRGRTQLFRYLISVLGSVLLNYLLLKFFVEAVHLYPTPSQAVTSLLIIGYSYLMQKYFTFRGCES